MNDCNKRGYQKNHHYVYKKGIVANLNEMVMILMF